MKRFMLSAAVAALAFPAVAYAGAQEGAVTAQPETQIEADTAASAALYLEADQISAKDLLGEEIAGEKGDQIAHIDDLVINADGKADTVVFQSGGAFGLGGKKGALDYSKVSVAVDEAADPRTSVSMTKDAIKSVAEFKTDEMNDYRLASELIGASAKLSASDDEATITDLILAQDGTVEHVIVQNGLIGSIGGEKVAIAYSDIAIEQGDGGGVVIDMTPEMLEAAPRFEYSKTPQYEPVTPNSPSQP
ncbi:MAG: PRC-barrel domain-containing protein [Pseudomonadota bacterium]|nr:PRC-barrel domain-containing protein [Pseudomonadota bacterium]